MLRYRIFYIAALILSLVFFTVYFPWFSWYLFNLVLMIAPLDLVLSLPGLFTKSAALSAPPFLEEYGPGTVVINIIHNKLFPVRCLYAKFLVTGDDFLAHCNVIIPAGSINRGEIVIDTSQTGLTVFELKKLSAVSLLGIFSKRIKNTGKVSVLVLPPAEKPAGTVNLPADMVLVPKPGGGFSEEHDMRPYLPGDRISNIHWKLSAKFDSLIVRQPLVPPHQSRLVHIMPWENAAQRRSALSHLRWISQYLLDNELSYYARFGDKGITYEVSAEADLIDFLRMVLDNTSILKPVLSPRVTRFAWVYTIDAARDLLPQADDFAETE